MTYDAVQMKTARLELRITDELLAQIDAARGDVSRTRWVERALESALSGSLVSESRGGPGNPQRAEQQAAQPPRDVSAPIRTFESGCPECGGVWVPEPGGTRRCADCGALVLS